MSEFIKAPWKFTISKNGIRQISGNNGLQICKLWNSKFTLANANLIAAAPEMYEALKYCLDCLGNEHALPSDCIDEAESALAKARGEI